MTNIDLADFYHLLSFIRAHPESPRTEQRLDLMLKALGEFGTETIKFSELTNQLPEIFFPSTYSIFLESNFCFHWDGKETIIEDQSVVDFFRMYVKELKKLYSSKKYNQIFYLINRLDNLPTNIIDDHNGKLSFKYLRKCLRPYWLKYDKTFAHQYIKDHLKPSKNKIV